MKNSSIFGTLAILIGIISVILFFKNETANPRSVQDIKEYTGRSNIIMGNGIPYMIEQQKKDNRNKILMWGGIPLILCSIAYFSSKSAEDKKDPQKNLKELRDNQIISDEEYKEKVAESKIILQRQKTVKTQKKESDKLIAELQNLKEKGIISESEYKKKLIKIREKTA